MTASTQQIVTAFEELGLTPEAIAEEFDFDLAVVKATLLQFSSTYRAVNAPGQSDTDFDDNEAKEMHDIILQIARYTEDEHLRFKAARYVRDDKKGRLDLGQQMAKLNINVLQFNAQMQKAIAAKQRAAIAAPPLSTTVVDNKSGPPTIDNGAPINDILDATVVDS